HSFPTRRSSDLGLNSPIRPVLSQLNKLLAHPPNIPQNTNCKIEGRTICKERRDPKNNQIPAVWLLLKSCQKLMEGLKSIIEFQGDQWLAKVLNKFMLDNGFINANC